MTALAPQGAFAADDKNPAVLTEAHFVKFQPIIMSVLQGRRIAGLVQFEITLKLADPSQRNAIIKERFRLQDQMVQAIAGMTRGAIRVDAPINIAVVSRVLQRHVDSVLGDKKTEVLIIDASTRVQ